MFLLPKIAALTGGCVVALAAASFAQNPRGDRAARSQGETVVVNGQVEWLERSDVSALTEGVIKQIEYQVGNRVEEGKQIGVLHDEKARLTLAKAKVAAENVGPIEKGLAQRQLAIAERARMKRANDRVPDAHSRSEIEKAEAEIMVAEAMTKEAREIQNVAKADQKIAERVLEEHIILAPFTGYIIERMKNPGEAVRASEPVVRLGRIDKLRFIGYVPLETSFRIKIGDLVELRPNVEGADLPIEQTKFKGKVAALSREISTIGKTEVQILAEIDNEDAEHNELGLRPGLKADMTVYLTPAAAKPVVGARAELKPAR
jgi:multidrug resistance efflux pump